MNGKLFELFPSMKPRRDAVPPDASSDEWFTPLKVFVPLHEEFCFSIDAAGCAEAPASQLIGDWYDKETDGLKQDYRGERVWCNCTYSDIAPWAELAVMSVRAGAFCFVMLLPAWTDRAWWHEFIEPHRRFKSDVQVELRFVKGRVKFGYPGNPHAQGKAGGGFDPSVIVIFKKG